MNAPYTSAHAAAEQSGLCRQAKSAIEWSIILMMRRVVYMCTHGLLRQLRTLRGSGDVCRCSPSCLVQPFVLGAARVLENGLSAPDRLGTGLQACYQLGICRNREQASVADGCSPRQGFE